MARKESTIGDAGWPKPDLSKVVKTNKNFKNKYHAALMYVHYEFSSLDLVKEVLKYLKSKDPKHPLIDRIRLINENRVAIYGKYMYILNHGGDIPDEIMVHLMDELEKTVIEEESKIKPVPLEEIPKVKISDKIGPSIQERIREKASEVSGEIEGWIDDWVMNKKLSVKTVEDFVALFKGNNLKAAHTIHIKHFFQKRMNEFEEVLKGNDPALVEAYSNFKKLELKRLIMMMRNLCMACDMIQDVAKVARVPRKKKPVSVEKVVSRLKYKKEDSQLGIVSQNPVHIIGSKEVWVYNTKTRKLGVYKAVDETGLTVKGTALLNFSADSVEKTVRKPAETLAEFKKASKVKLRTFLTELTTLDVPCPGKLNENHVILRIDK